MCVRMDGSRGNRGQVRHKQGGAINDEGGVNGEAPTHTHKHIVHSCELFQVSAALANISERCTPKHTETFALTCFCCCVPHQHQASTGRAAACIWRIRPTRTLFLLLVVMSVFVVVVVVVVVVFVVVKKYKVARVHQVQQQVSSAAARASAGGATPAGGGWLNSSNTKLLSTPGAAGWTLASQPLTKQC